MPCSARPPVPPLLPADSTHIGVIPANPPDRGPLRPPAPPSPPGEPAWPCMPLLPAAPDPTANSTRTSCTPGALTNSAPIWARRPTGASGISRRISCTVVWAVMLRATIPRATASLASMFSVSLDWLLPAPHVCASRPPSSATPSTSTTELLNSWSPATATASAPRADAASSPSASEPNGAAAVPVPPIAPAATNTTLSG